MDMSDRSKWCLQWVMDGFQWEVLAVYMYEGGVPIGDEMKAGTWLECFTFMYKHLLTRDSPSKFVTIYTNDNEKYIVDRKTIVDVLKKEYPEEFI